MKYLGETFRELRESRNVSMTTVCGGNLSKSQMSRFERGESDIRLSVFCEALSNLGVSLQEFEYIHQGYQYDKRRKLLECLSNLSVNGNIAELKKLLEQQERIAQEGKACDYWDFLMLKAVFARLTDKEILTIQEKQEMTDYLFSVEEWSYFQLIFYVNTITTYNFETVLLLSKELISRSTYYREISKNRRLVLHGLLNTMYVCAFQKKVREGKYFEKAINEIIKEEDLYERNVLLVMCGLLECASGNIEEGKRKIKRGIKIFYLLGSVDLSRSYQEDLRKILEICQ